MTEVRPGPMIEEDGEPSAPLRPGARRPVRINFARFWTGPIDGRRGLR
jgi:hypothetical protein